MIPVVRDNPAHYEFADISQVNSRSFGDAHWERVCLKVPQMHEQTRPTDCAKTYGGGYTGDWVGEAILNRGDPGQALRRSTRRRFEPLLWHLPRARHGRSARRA